MRNCWQQTGCTPHCTVCSFSAKISRQTSSANNNFHWRNGYGVSNKNQIKSGDKYETAQGFKAIKNGMKPGANARTFSKPPGCLLAGERCQPLKIPSAHIGWPRSARNLTAQYRRVEPRHCHHYVDGTTCTRACRFCAVTLATPRDGWTLRTGKCGSIRKTHGSELCCSRRPDDGGAGHYAACIRAIRELNPTTVEALTPDFNGDEAAVAEWSILACTICAKCGDGAAVDPRGPRPRAGYNKPDVLAYAKSVRPDVLTKSSLMLGIGETDDEVRQTLEDLKSHRVDIDLGQYMRPTKPSARRSLGDAGSLRSSARVWAGLALLKWHRDLWSSYRADRVLEGNNWGFAPEASDTDTSRLNNCSLNRR